MTKQYGRITGWGMYVPDRVLTNHDLEQMVDTSDEWIVSRTGIRERRIAEAGETCSTMAVEAAQRALARSGVSPEELELVIVATSSPDYFTPPVSSIVQHHLGARKAGAFTLGAGCTGFVYSLVTASQFIETGRYDKILVIGVEHLSIAVDWTDRNTCVLFGDGAGAVIMEASHQPTGVLSAELGSKGQDWDALIFPGGGSARPFGEQTLANKEQYLRMDGRRVFKFATRAMTDSTRRVVHESGLSWGDIEFLIPHQANARIIDLAVRRLKIDPAKVIVNLDRYGNTSAASIPLALCEAADQGRLKPDDHLVLVGFGAGLTWAAAVVHWQPEKVDEAPILVENWPVPERLRQPVTTLRNAMWSAGVVVRSRLQEASTALLLPLYTWQGRRRKRQKQQDKK
jgi:3-oxoacyl-[acyl-carrier-protein] synthase-3